MGSKEYKIQEEEMWDKTAPHYGRIGPPFFQICAEQLVELTPLKPGEKVLDVATGTGFVALEAAPKVDVDGHVTGIDISGGMVEKAKKNAKDLGLTNVDFIRMDAENLEFPDSSFDVVICGMSLFLFPDQVQAIREMYRVLKVGGILLLSDWNATYLSPGGTTFTEVLGEKMQKGELEVLNEDVAEAMGKMVLFQPHTLEALLKEINFHGIQIIQKDIDFWCKDAQEVLDFMLASGNVNTGLSLFSESSQSEIKKEVLMRFQALTTNKGILSNSRLLYALGRK
jgi:ubiquinone/menaquinone biosynthesis C-methylase UbiE